MIDHEMEVRKVTLDRIESFTGLYDDDWSELQTITLVMLLELLLGMDQTGQ